MYHEGLVHFAVVVVAGGGKSSLVNDFCGSRNKDIGSLVLLASPRQR